MDFIRFLDGKLVYVGLCRCSVGLHEDLLGFLSARCSSGSSEHSVFTASVPKH